MNITDVIKQLIDEYACDPYEINNGCCDCFAMDIIERMGGYSDYLYEVWDDDAAHCYVVYKDRCYDAECPEGVKNCRQLPIFA